MDGRMKVLNVYGLRVVVVNLSYSRPNILNFVIKCRVQYNG